MSIQQVIHRVEEVWEWGASRAPACRRRALVTLATFLALMVTGAPAPEGGPCPPPGMDPGYGEWGDAPEGTLAYPSLGIAGNFPTCLALIPAPYVHHGFAMPAIPNLWFGTSVDGEDDGNADLCPSPPYEMDECWGPFDGDGGLVSPDPFTFDPGLMEIPCGQQPTRPLGAICDVIELGPGSSPLEATVTSMNPADGYINILFDWNQDGRWGGDVPGCNGPIPEHAIQNLAVPAGYGGPLSGLNPGTIEIGPSSGFVWMRMTITESPVMVPWDGSGCFDLGETEDYLIQIVDELAGEYGDAPEGALAYPTGITGAFPTCRGIDLSGYIVHTSPGALWFGGSVDVEGDGNVGQCPPAPYDQDECADDGDAGLIRPRAYTLDAFGSVSTCPSNQALNDMVPCQPATWGQDIDISVTNQTSSDAFVNVLIDWNGDGQWAGGLPGSCPGNLPAPEQVIHDLTVPPGFSGPLSDLAPPQFTVGSATGYAWCRFTISEAPLGPVEWTGAGTFADGETEDYLIYITPNDVAGDYGDAPEGVEAYPGTGVIGKFPTCRSPIPAGHVHHAGPNTSWFGPARDFELDGNAGQCPMPPYDDDECVADLDAGLLIPRAFSIDLSGNATACPNQPSTQVWQSCQAVVWGTDIDIQVWNLTSATRYVNVLIDWNRDGMWQNTALPTCGTATEHVLVDFPVNGFFNGPLSILGPPDFDAGDLQNDGGYVWARFSITDQPVFNNWNGEGDFLDGETEDYLLGINVPTSVDDAFDVPGTPTVPIALTITPNPFNPRTRITLDLERDAQTVVRIHDIAGRVLRRLWVGHLTAGRHDLAWDGTADSGVTVTSGVYVVAVDSGGVRVSEKLIVLK